MNIGSQIKIFRGKKGWSQKELAAKLDMSQSAVAAWENNRNGPNPTQRDKLCKIFGITIAELYGNLLTSKEPFPVQQIPVISWVHANKFEDINDPFPAGISDEYIYSTIKGEHIFALKVQNDCMEPEFREGDLIIIKPNVAITSGDYVVIADRDENKATFKQYKEYGTKKILHPLNPKYQDIELDHKRRYTIVGKVTEKIKKY